MGNDERSALSRRRRDTGLCDSAFIVSGKFRKDFWRLNHLNGRHGVQRHFVTFLSRKEK